MELITRARTRLAVVLVGHDGYAETKEYFQQAADLGLLEMVHLSGGASEISQHADDESNEDGGEEEIEGEGVEAVDDKMDEKMSCMPDCTS